MGGAWRDLRWTLACWISRVGVRFGRFLPTRVWYLLSIPVAEACFIIMRRHRAALEANLARVVGPEQARATARQVFRNFARYVIDFYQLPSLGPGALQKRVDFHDWQQLDEALDDPNGTLFVTLHLGQAELGGAALATYGHEVNAIAETLQPESMNRFIQGLRQALGIKIIPANRAKPGVLRCLKGGEVLALMFDAVEGGDALPVRFFGATAIMSSTPARIALRTGARVLPVVISRDRDDPLKLVPCVDFDLKFEPTGNEEEDVRTLTQRIATSLEVFVRRFPEQWFAFSEVWPSTSEAAPKSDESWRLWALQAGVVLGRALPRRLAYGLARVAADLAFKYRRQARLDVEDNMRHVLGKEAPQEAVSAAARDAFRNVARYYVDLIRLAKMPPQELLSRVRLHGFDRLKSYIDSGRGVIVATAHFGNPEIGVQVGAVLGLNVLVLAEPLQPPAFASLMRRIRAAFGPRYEDVGFSSVAESLRHLRSGGVLAITCDRDIQGKGVPLLFFDAMTKLPLGAVELAARTGAVLVPGYCRRSGDGFDLYFEEPVELVDSGRPKEDAAMNARALLRRAEVWIRSDPGQWMVLERVWKPVAETKIKPRPTQPREESVVG